MEWSREEVEAIVADYLQMLALELAGQSFNKSEHRRRLQSKLNDRSNGSIEFKHCNISAALIDLGYPSIRGYQPRANYQSLLLEVVAEQLRTKESLDEIVLSAIRQPVATPQWTNFSTVKTEGPKRQFRTREAELPPLFKASKRDYLQREAQNMSLGLAGEEFVTLYEHWRLTALGEHRLADRVEHVAKTKGDGLGYDVLSFDSNGRERLIEVKTTNFGKETPFFVSKNELRLSKGNSDQFHLYRLFEFKQQPRLFDLPGALDTHCELDPVSYRASFN
jgi:Domain of unknown function (DUF3883)